MGPSGQGAVTPQQLEFSRLALRLGVSLGAVSSRLGTCPGPSETLTPQTGSGHRGLPRAPPLVALTSIDSARCLAGGGSAPHWEWPPGRCPALQKRGKWSCVIRGLARVKSFVFLSSSQKVVQAEGQMAVSARPGVVWGPGHHCSPRVPRELLPPCPNSLTPGSGPFLPLLAGGREHTRAEATHLSPVGRACCSLYAAICHPPTRWRCALTAEAKAGPWDPPWVRLVRPRPEPGLGTRDVRLGTL